MDRKRPPRGGFNTPSMYATKIPIIRSLRTARIIYILYIIAIVIIVVTFAAIASRPAGHADHIAVIRAQVMTEIVVSGTAEFRAPVAVIVILAPDPVLVHESRPDTAGRPGVLLLHPSVAEF